MTFTHLLITRPEAESEQLADLLAEPLAGAGLQAIVLPAYRFEATHPGFDFASAWTSGKRSLAVFTSRRAVVFGLRQLPAGFLDGVQVAAIGPTTANELDRAGHGVSVLPESGYTSEDLLRHPDLAQNPGDVLIFAAPGGRDLLRAGLEKNGWKVRMAMVYRRVDLEPGEAVVSELEASRGVLSVWTSANAMKVLHGRLPEAVWRKICEGHCVTISERLERELRSLGAGDVSVTDGPGNEAIRAGILRLI